MADHLPDVMQSPVVKQSLELLQRLLTPARTRVELVSGRPILPAGEVGALAVVGMKTEAPRTWVSVFIFRTYDEATVGLRTVKAAAGPTDGQCVISALNGHMVLYGRGAGEDDTAAITRYVLDSVLAAFDQD